MKKYLDTSLSFEERAEYLVKHMKLKEKTAQMLSRAPKIRRLGVPEYHWWNECLHGVGRAGLATVFPQAIGLAAIFDPEFMYEVATAISDEARAKHHEFQRQNDHRIYKGLTFWSPNINIFRDPRWGRGQETYGEDPFLTSQLGISFVKGLQGDDPKYLKLVATPKHYAVHSGPEKLRHEFNAVVSKKDLYETYLIAFKECIEKAQAYSIMGAYNRTNGEPCCGSKTLLKDILRDQFKFEGFVVSDCGAIWDFHAHHKITSGPSESAAMAVKNGCDLNCGITYKFLNRAVKKKLLTEQDIDISVKRLMLARMKLGMFDPEESVPYAKIPYQVNNCKKHQELALIAAEKSIVLLKNADNFLPISFKNKTVAVIGPNADDEKALWGNYNGFPEKTITPLAGLRLAAQNPTQIEFAPGTTLSKPDENLLTNALTIARKADIIVLCLGLSQALEGEEGAMLKEGDRSTLGLPPNQLHLCEQISKLFKPIILVLLNGSPILLDWAVKDPNIKAVIEAWYPGQAGGTAIANILLGYTSPSGRLPITFPMKMDDIPPIEDYNMKGRTYRYSDKEPCFPFGFGLSYSDFDYKNMRLSSNQVKMGENISIDVEVMNKGNFEAEEVAQLYLKDMEASVPIPQYSLQGLKRLRLKPGQTIPVRFEITARQMAIINMDGKTVIEPGKFTIFVGGQQPDSKSEQLTRKKPVEASFEVIGKPLEVNY